MVTSDFLPSIELNIPKKLLDRDYRKRFFLAEASALIAEQLIELRKRRGLTQTELAEKAETGQPAISRVERADYHNWSFRTLRTLADLMDARIRVLIEPSEDVLHEYEAQQIPEPNFVPNTRDIDKLLEAIIRPHPAPPPTPTKPTTIEELAGLDRGRANSATTARTEHHKQEPQSNLTGIVSLFDKRPPIDRRQSISGTVLKDQTLGATWN